MFFYLNKIPYVYFEATAIVDEEGNIVNPESPYAYHTSVGDRERLDRLETLEDTAEFAILTCEKASKQKYKEK